MLKQATAFCIFLLMLCCTSVKDISFKKRRILKKNSEMRNRLITISTGRIGCPPEVIEIKDYYELDSFHEAWTAICFKRVFYCSYNNVSPACSERIDSPENVVSPAPVRKVAPTPTAPVPVPAPAEPKVAPPKLAPLQRKAPLANPPKPQLN